QFTPGLQRWSSFDIDDHGSISWAAAGLGPSPTVGADLGAFGGLQENSHPDGADANYFAPLTYALDNLGRPAFAGSRINGQRTLSRFNTQTGAWQTQGVPTSGASATFGGGYASTQALTFDNQNNAIVGFGQTGGVSPLFVQVEDGVSGWRDLAGGQFVQRRWGISIAAASTGEIGFAFVDPNNDLVFGHYDGAITAYETIANQPSTLTPRSLAYDETSGTFQIVYNEAAQPGSQIDQVMRIAQRTAANNWVDEVLPVRGYYGSLAFDPTGNAYIGAATPGNIAMIARNAPAGTELHFWGATAASANTSVANAWLSQQTPANTWIANIGSVTGDQTAIVD
ncbi:MAG: hypothetical protein MI741_01315, partial [Rhodospirillales bacterium]|nr:hypothetical protein [Rhodospirillales bacterium]